MVKTFKEFIPTGLYSLIIEHIKNHCPKWMEKSYESGQTEEDAVTGFFFGQLSIDKDISPRYPKWDWALTYNQTGGRGKGSFESASGADGTFEITIKNDLGEVLFQKGFLFQAKMDEKYSAKTLLEQVNKMENIASKSSAVIFYGKNGYKAVKSDKYILKKYKEQDVCDFIINEFFECKYGKLDMSFDTTTKELSLRKNGRIKKYNAKELKHFVALNISKSKI